MDVHHDRYLFVFLSAWVSLPIDNLEKDIINIYININIHDCTYVSLSDTKSIPARRG